MCWNVQASPKTWMRWLPGSATKTRCAVTVTANDATVDTEANAENAGVTVTANDPTTAITIPVENAAVTAVANDATVDVAIDALAENVAGAATANDATLAIDAISTRLDVERRGEADGGHEQPSPTQVEVAGFQGEIVELGNP